VTDVASNQVPGVRRLAWQAEIQVIKLVRDATPLGTGIDEKPVT